MLIRKHIFCIMCRLHLWGHHVFKTTSIVKIWLVWWNMSCLICFVTWNTKDITNLITNMSFANVLTCYAVRHSDYQFHLSPCFIAQNTKDMTNLITHRLFTNSLNCYVARCSDYIFSSFIVWNAIDTTNLITNTLFANLLTFYAVRHSGCLF